MAQPHELQKKFTLRTAKSSDADEQAALLAGWNQNYVQLSRGRFDGALTESCLDGVRLFVESTSQSLLQGGMLQNDVIAVGVPIKMTGPAVFCGTKVHRPAVFVFSGSEGFEFRSPPGLMMSGIVVPRAAVLELLSDPDRERITPLLAHAHITCVDDARMNAARHLNQAIFRLLASGQPVAPARLHDLRINVLSHVAELILGCSAPEPPLRRRHRWRIVAEVRRIALESACGPTSIAEVCRAVGVSRRTLQYCFEETLGLTPLEFLRTVRLHGARRLLRSAPSVTDAATQYGFWHLSYFSHDYRTLFGELPSQTHRRYHADSQRL
jgi:AraC family ethanolamine operon transcriptional activator